MRAVLALALAFTLQLPGCDALSRFLDGLGPRKKSFQEQNIGLAAFPPATDAAPALQHWRTLLIRPPAYRFGYALASEQARHYADAHHQYGEDQGYRYLGADRITFHATDECGFDLRCVYQELERTNRDAVNAIAQRFLEYGHASRLTTQELSLLMITYVQSLRYERPSNEPFDILPPALVASDRMGDCDSKALLAYMLLRAVGVDCLLLRSGALSHVALGVRLPGNGFSVVHQGRRYFYVEMTYPNWPIGMVPPEYQRPHAWRALPVN